MSCSAETLPTAFAGVTAAFYLVHIMNGVADFRERNKLAARNFGQAARAAGVQRIVYLGSLGNAEADRSQRLLSRQETGDALREAARACPSPSFAPASSSAAAACSLR